MSPVFLYNTLTGKKEEFKPITEGAVGMYTCGPTVYNYAHIGNLRAYVFTDTLRRALQYNGYKVKQVMNITDVGHLTSDSDDGDDKMIKALKREGKPFTFEAMQEIARKYETAFKEDLRALNIEIPMDMPRASEHIAEDIEIIEKLLEKGFAYKTSDGIYFDISKFPEYGTRGGFKLGELMEGARVAVNAEKKNPRDFSLWKFSTTDLGWDFPPYGKGFPGWHVECSAMSRKYLDQPFDIHTGGIDHIPTHHQNEIAQSEAAYGVPLANYWMHNAHLTMAGEKMAKSGENFLTLSSLREKGMSPVAYRYSLLTTHYSKPMSFTVAGIPGAVMAYRAFTDAYARLEGGTGEVDEESAEAFLNAINNDLNFSVALSVAWGVLNDEKLSDGAKKTTLRKFDEVLGLALEETATANKKNTMVPEEVKKLAKEREQARKAKDFKKSDELRERISEAGFEMMDTDSGPIIRKKI